MASALGLVHGSASSVRRVCARASSRRSALLTSAGAVALDRSGAGAARNPRGVAAQRAVRPARDGHSAGPLRRAQWATVSPPIIGSSTF